MSKIITIYPEKGMNNLSFGASGQDIMKEFGKPDWVETFTDCDDNATLVWGYKNPSLTFFLEGINHEFAICEIYPGEVLLNNENPFSMSPNAILDFMNRLGYTCCESENEAWNQHRFSFDEAGMDFWVENDKLAIISISKPLK